MILEASTTSGLLTAATTSVSSKPAILMSLILNPGSATSSVVLYDNASAASGTVLAELVAAANGPSIPIAFPYGINALNGITAVVSGTAATATFSYQRIG